MNIILWRHATAEDTFPDHDRDLTTKGELQAQKMGQWLRRNLTGTLLTLVSPSKRTLQTAKWFSEDVHLHPSVKVSSKTEQILELIEYPPQATDNLVIVAHQPFLGEVASRLLTGSNHPIKVNKGSIWWFIHKHGTYHLHTVINPDLL